MAWRAEIDGLPFATVSPEEASSLELPFREEEVFTAIKEMDGDKASSPNGFTMAFWQASWHLVKGEIMEMFRDFHANETFIRSLNATFLVLIPKKGDAEDLKDFRPISLLGSLHKILAKVLANRLKKGKFSPKPKMLLWKGDESQMPLLLLTSSLTTSKSKRRRV